MAFASHFVTFCADIDVYVYNLCIYLCIYIKVYISSLLSSEHTCLSKSYHVFTIDVLYIFSFYCIVYEPSSLLYLKLI